MEKNLKTTFLSDFNFLRLLIATIILKNERSIIDNDKLEIGGPIIDNHKLEKELCKYYDRKEYNFLFEDIFKENNYLNLNCAFQRAYNYGILSPIQDDLHEIRSIVNFTKSEARQIQSIYSSEYITAMSNICDEMFGLKSIAMNVIAIPGPTIITKGKLESTTKEDLKFIEKTSKEFVDNNLVKIKVKSKKR